MEIEDKAVIAIVVTYGKRWHLLRSVIRAAQDELIYKIIVVDNGSIEDIHVLAEREFSDFCVVITVGENTGSAGGFKIGLENALLMNAGFIMLLDDDNKLEPGCVKELMQSFELELNFDSKVGLSNLAILGFRPDHQPDVAFGLSESRVNSRVGSTFGFHIFDLPFKIWRRTAIGRKSIVRHGVAKRVELQVAPWSGLFFHRKLVERFGMPNEHLVLYGDDTEYTSRITTSGGKIVLNTAALLKDLDVSWNIKGRNTNSFDGLLLGNSDFRLYYSVRNQVYLEEYVFPKTLLSPINRRLYLFMLYLRAIFLRKFEKWNVIEIAVRDGRQRRLGKAPMFPI